MKNNNETNSLTKRLPDKVCSIDIEKWNNVVELLGISDVVYQRNCHKVFKECDINGKTIKVENWFFRSLYGNDAHKSTVKTVEGKFLHLCWFYPEWLDGIMKSISKHGDIIGKTRRRNGDVITYVLQTKVLDDDKYRFYSWNSTPVVFEIVPVVGR